MDYLLHKLDPTHNQRRYYRIHIGPCIGSDFAVFRTWGRLGRRRSGVLIQPCADQAEAERLAETLITRKLKRGYIIVRKGEQTMTTELTEKLNQLAELAKQAGAEGIWLIRGAFNARLIYSLSMTKAEEAEWLASNEAVRVNTELRLDIADTGVLMVMRFPADVRPDTGNLRDYFILWEVEQWSDRPLQTVPDFDPFLLRHIMGDYERSAGGVKCLTTSPGATKCAGGQPGR